MGLGPWSTSLGALQPLEAGLLGGGVQTVTPISGLGFSWWKALCKEEMSLGKGLKEIRKAAGGGG